MSLYKVAVAQATMDKLSKEVYSQLSSYTEEPSGTTIMLYVIVLIGLLVMIYTLHSLSNRLQLWTVQTFLLLEMLLVYFLFMPITALHPHIILVNEEFAILSHSILQKYAIIRIFTYIYYITFIYTFTTIVMINIAHLFTQEQLKERSRNFSPIKKLLLCVLNVPITGIVAGAFSDHFGKLIESETANPDLPPFMTIDISDNLFIPVISVFSMVILLYMLFSYWIHRKMERVLFTCTFEEKSRELLYLEMQVMFGSFYGVFPCIILVSSFLIKSSQSRMVVSELITFCFAVQPILCSLLILAGHKSLRWPTVVKKVLKKEQDSRQWATPRQTSVSLGTAMTTKRDDLQAIRGIAISLVLLFHLQPHRFPLGFVGVDIFFVLSGFLMAMILSKEGFGAKVVTVFYVRRFKRIVPVYYVTILSVFIGCAFILLPIDKDQLLVDLKWAVSFTSNLQPFFEIKGYWDQITEYRFLVHCWSLGVEMQFYVLAPFLIGTLNWLTDRWRSSSIILLIVLSIGFQLLTDSKVAYDLLPSRIWQFLLGVLCFKRKIKPNDQKTAEKQKLLEELETDALVEKPETSGSIADIFKEILLLGLILTVFLNLTGSYKLMRVVSCLSIALIIKYPSKKSVLSNSVLIYLGDLSYTMYLLHWPVIVAVKYYYSIRELDILGTVILASAIVILTVIAHYIVEKPLASASTSTGFLISVLCFVAIYFSKPYYNQYRLSTRGNEENINITEAIEWNLFESKKDFYPLPCDPDNVTSAWTNFTVEAPFRCQTYSNGTLKILVIGNSIAYRAFPLIKEVLKGRYKELRLFSRSSAPPLSDKNPEMTAATRIVADRIRPDVIWHIHNERDTYMLEPIVNLSTDRAFLEFQKNLDYYTGLTKYFIIDLPYFYAESPVCHELALRLQHGNSLDDLKTPQSEVVKQQSHHRTRLLSLNCMNCLYNPIEDYLLDGDTYWYYNRENFHGYTKEGRHFTPEFLPRLKPLYEKTVEDVLKRLQ